MEHNIPSTKKNVHKGAAPKTRSALLLLCVVFLLLLCILALLPSRETLGESLGESLGETLFKKNGSGADDSHTNDTYKDSEDTEQAHENTDGINAKLAIVIDDAGDDLDLIAPLLTFPGQLTIAVLPHLAASSTVAARVVEAGKEVILHCPMEALSGVDPGPGTIGTSFLRERILTILERNFESIPYATGMSNHMGSKATADYAVMDAVLYYLKERGFYFLDSKTSSASVADVVADKYGVSYYSRDVFIDNVREQASIEAWISKGIEIALDRGYAILIGHINSRPTILALNAVYPQLKERGIELVGISDLPAERE